MTWLTESVVSKDRAVDGACVEWDDNKTISENVKNIEENPDVVKKSDKKVQPATSTATLTPIAVDDVDGDDKSNSGTGGGDEDSSSSLVGAIIGVVAGLVLIGVVVFFVWKWKRSADAVSACRLT